MGGVHCAMFIRKNESRLESNKREKKTHNSLFYSSVCGKFFTHTLIRLTAYGVRSQIFHLIIDFSDDLLLCPCDAWHAFASVCVSRFSSMV